MKEYKEQDIDEDSDTDTQSKTFSNKYFINNNLKINSITVPNDKSYSKNYHNYENNKFQETQDKNKYFYNKTKNPFQKSEEQKEKLRSQRRYKNLPKDVLLSRRLQKTQQNIKQKLLKNPNYLHKSLRYKTNNSKDVIQIYEKLQIELGKNDSSEDKLIKIKNINEYNNDIINSMNEPTQSILDENLIDKYNYQINSYKYQINSYKYGSQHEKNKILEHKIRHRNKEKIRHRNYYFRKKLKENPNQEQNPVKCNNEDKQIYIQIQERLKKENKQKFSEENELEKDNKLKQKKIIDDEYQDKIQRQDLSKLKNVNQYQKLEKQKQKLKLNNNQNIRENRKYIKELDYSI